MLRLNFSLKFEKAIRTKQVVAAAYKAVAFVATCVCLIIPGPPRKQDSLETWSRSAFVRSDSVSLTTSLAFCRPAGR
jgi:hypothetical protein